MKWVALVILIAFVAATAGFWAGGFASGHSLNLFALEPVRQYQCILFGENGKDAEASGRLKAAADRELFTSGIYLGPDIDIPPDARGIGVLVFQRGDKAKLITVRTWQRDGKNQIGCNGPSPRFALCYETPEEFLQGVAQYLGD